jgi:hypothetical protein
MEPEPDRPRATPPLSTSSPPLHHAEPPASIFIELFNTASPKRQGAGLQHREDVAVEAMDRAALLPLLQAVPLPVTTSSPPCPEREVRNPLDLVVDPAFEPRLDQAL